MTKYYCAWWNVENLFDIENSSERPDWLAKKLKAELKGWTSAILDTKLKQLAKVISAMNGNLGPDILGVCEIENKVVLQGLVEKLNISGRQYAIAHHDTSDQRGIDIAFIYDKKLFRKEEQFSHVILKRNATRDIFQVNFKTLPQENLLILIGNHWPSRLGGEAESEPYRIIAAETLSYWVKRIDEIFKRQAPVIVLGDFNDEPFNRSLMDYALAERDSRRVKSKKSRKPYLLNLMWPLVGNGKGTHYYNEWGMLDQAMINRPFFHKNSPIRMVKDSASIFTIKGMVKRNKIQRFGRPRKSLNEQGFSDHLPIALQIEETD